MTYREKALQIAKTQLGVTENPPGSNWGLEVKQYLNSADLNFPAPWCMAFVNWCYRQAGLNLEHPHEASVGFFLDWANRNGYVVNRPGPGDLVCYRFDSDSWPDHVGIVESAGPTRILTIEGNTAVGNDANGGKVMRRTRSLARCSFVRIPGDVPVPRRQLVRRAVLRAWILKERAKGRPWDDIKGTANFREWQRLGGK